MTSAPALPRLRPSSRRWSRRCPRLPTRVTCRCARSCSTRTTTRTEASSSSSEWSTASCARGTGSGSPRPGQSTRRSRSACSLLAWCRCEQRLFTPAAVNRSACSLRAWGRGSSRGRCYGRGRLGTSMEQSSRWYTPDTHTRMYHMHMVPRRASTVGSTYAYVYVHVHAINQLIKPIN